MSKHHIIIGIKINHDAHLFDSQDKVPVSLSLQELCSTVCHPFFRSNIFFALKCTSTYYSCIMSPNTFQSQAYYVLKQHQIFPGRPYILHIFNKNWFSQTLYTLNYSFLWGHHKIRITKFIWHYQCQCKNLIILQSSGCLLKNKR